MSNLEIAHCRIHTLERLRGITAREHELFHNRTNTFWVWESILLAGYGWSRTVDILKFLIPIFGSACHASVGADRTHKFHAQWYLRDQVLRHEAELEPEDRILTNLHLWRTSVRRPFFGIAVSQYFAYAFPLLWLVTWLIILLVALF